MSHFPNIRQYKETYLHTFHSNSHETGSKAVPLFTSTPLPKKAGEEV